MSLWDKILYKGKSPISGEIKVTENYGKRRLVIGGFTQSQTLRPDGYTGQLYWDRMVPEDISLQRDSRVLILGLGAGSIAKIITSHFGPVTIDGIEIDSEIIELARKYFSLNEPNINIIVADARKFVKDARFKYDLICVDLFMSDKVPEGVETNEFFNSVKNLLKEEGKVMINKIFNGKNELEDYQNFVRQIFPKVGFFVVRGNVETDNVIVTAEN
jgi:spermidine synthase